MSGANCISVESSHASPTMWDTTGCFRNPSGHMVNFSNGLYVHTAFTLHAMMEFHASAMPIAVPPFDGPIPSETDSAPCSVRESAASKRRSYTSNLVTPTFQKHMSTLTIEHGTYSMIY